MMLKSPSNVNEAARHLFADYGAFAAQPKLPSFEAAFTLLI